MRRPNWTDEESLLLAQLIEERKEIIRRKSSAGVTVLAKRQAWEEIAQAVNLGFPQYQRTVPDCTKKWENLLAKSRNEIKRQRMHMGKCDNACCAVLVVVVLQSPFVWHMDLSLPLFGVY